MGRTPHHLCLRTASGTRIRKQVLCESPRLTSRSNLSSHLTLFRYPDFCLMTATTAMRHWPGMAWHGLTWPNLA